MCNRSDLRGGSQSGGAYQYYGILIGVVVGIKHGYPTIWQQWWERIQRQEAGLDHETVVPWLGGPDAIEHFPCSRLVVAFMWMVQRIEEG